MDGCQECLRESRGDRVMSHDERTCTDASTWHVQILLSFLVWCLAGLWTLVLMYAFGPSSLATLWPSVSVREQPGSRITDEHIQVTGRIPTPVGVGILQAHCNFIEPSVLCIFTGETSTSVEFYFTFVQQAQLHATTSGLHWRKSKGLTPTWLLLLYSLFSCFPVAGWRESGWGPTPVQHQGRRRSVRWTECVTFPLGQGCACQTSFPT